MAVNVCVPIISPNLGASEFAVPEIQRLASNSYYDFESGNILENNFIERDSDGFSISPSGIMNWFLEFK